MSQRTTDTRQTGAIVVTILALMIFFSTMLIGLVAVAQANLSRARGRIMLLQAQYAAESGADAAIAELNASSIDPPTYSGTTSDVTLLNSGQYRATYKTSVTNPSGDSKRRIITATGKVYDPASSTTPTYKRTIRITAERTSTTTASSMLSRNIIDVQSGVKQITGRDIYVNGYINAPKNTTDIIAENITVAGSNPSSSNCSLGPDTSSNGNLVPPASYTDPAQTQTIIRLAGRNCLSVDSPANFVINENQTNISTIKSTYIPWSQFMDGSYQNSPGGCNDWSGSGTINIPSTGNTKKTHYPNSASGVTNSCGTNGNLNLGSNTYVLHDSAHVRADLCATSACNPTFNNPDSDTKYLFVEGTVNFSSVKTSAGSGPIVLLTYGADPVSKNSDCSLGGSIYLGQQGSGYTRAPALYMLAMNGLCIDGTKFGASPSDSGAMLGGVGGKNIFINSSPSTPRPLSLDPNFPVDEIPIDLSWRAVYYERL